MLKYKDTYFIGKPKDSKGKATSNKDDCYIRCKKNVHIFRYNSDTLSVMFLTNRYANNRLQELSDANVQMKPFQIGDNEQVYLFPESDLTKVADVVMAKKRIKRNLTEEQREVLRERMRKIHSKNDS